MQPIIALTDFSATAFNAARYAADMATRIGCKVLLLHVLPPTEDPDDAILQMALLHGALSSAEGPDHIDTQLLCGELMTELERFAVANDPFAIIAGAKGNGPGTAHSLGRNIHYLANGLKWPLLVVPPEARFHSIDTIGLACEMKNIADTIPLKGLSSLFSRFKASLEALYVMKPASDTQAGQRVERLDAGISMLAHSDVAGGVSDFVRANHIDLLLTIPKERGFLDTLFDSVLPLGSRRPDVPVMVLHA